MEQEFDIRDIDYVQVLFITMDGRKYVGTPESVSDKYLAISACDKFAQIKDDETDKGTDSKY